MSFILPYEMPALVTTAPLDIHRGNVLPEWVDWNGHMNVAFYVAAFDQASGAFMRNMGLGRRYVDGKHGMTFVLETHVTYDREMKAGAPMRFTTQLLDRDAKLRGEGVVEKFVVGAPPEGIVDDPCTGERGVLEV